ATVIHHRVRISFRTRVEQRRGGGNFIEEDLSDHNPKKPWRQRDPDGTYHYVVFSDRFAIDDYFSSQPVEPIKRFRKEELRRIFPIRAGLRKEGSDYIPFLLLNFYKMVGVEEELQDNVRLFCINPKRINGYNVALIANPPVNMVHVTEEAFAQAPKCSPQHIPEIAKSDSGKILIVDLTSLLKNYMPKFLEGNNLYEQYYPIL
ncbi:hypothetical protein KY308_04330, partial [Candidatus Woesearchaeota archaeon]|nr:hypothetical protein [Candidatus Woesearchaeota archaeon]